MHISCCRRQLHFRIPVDGNTYSRAPLSAHPRQPTTTVHLAVAWLHHQAVANYVPRRHKRDTRTRAIHLIEVMKQGLKPHGKGSRDHYHSKSEVVIGLLLLPKHGARLVPTTCRFVHALKSNGTCTAKFGVCTAQASQPPLLCLSQKVTRKHSSTPHSP